MHCNCGCDGVGVLATFISALVLHSTSLGRLNDATWEVNECRYDEVPDWAYVFFLFLYCTTKNVGGGLAQGNSREINGTNEIHILREVYRVQNDIVTTLAKFSIGHIMKGIDLGAFIPFSLAFLRLSNSASRHAII